VFEGLCLVLRREGLVIVVRGLKVWRLRFSGAVWFVIFV